MSQKLPISSSSVSHRATKLILFRAYLCDWAGVIVLSGIVWTWREVGKYACVYWSRAS